jgi:eukaryotic-like serine/threonine-protein kinase
MSWLREPDAEPIPGYRLIEPLGAGGFGEVWKCVAPGGIFKAIKFVYGNLESEEADAARADQEYKALQRIKEVRHPFVLSMDRIEVVEGEIAIVMELADKSLHDAIVEYQSKGQVGIPRPELIRYLTDAADALDYLNGHFSLQHLDVKPRNLFVIADRVKVADFGLVKNLDRPSSAGVMGGVTPIYAAPETFGGKLSRHCDQYSLAIVYMELLTGKRPFHGKNVRQIALQHMTEPPDLAPLPPPDRPIVARALAKDPEHRFPNCASFLRAVSPGGPPPPVTEVDLSEEADLGQTSSPIPIIDPQAEKEMNDLPATAQIPKSQAPKVARPTRPEIVVPKQGPRLAPTKPVIDLALPPNLAAVDGPLRPTLVIGVGSFGRQALLGVRCRLLDRFGNLEHIPSFRYLYLDADPEAVQKATAGTSEVALSSAEVFPLPLQPVSNYRRRMLDHLLEWLPREKLYSIPRSLQPQGSRALGRLAFCDNFLRFHSRLRRELLAAMRPEAITESAEATKLKAGTAVPRIMVLLGATEGISGLLIDLAFAIRRTLDQINVGEAPMIAHVYCGTPFDPATPQSDQSNLYATLTELNHFTDEGVSFNAQYGSDGPQMQDPRPPFDAVYLSIRNERTPAGMRETLAHLGTVLAQEIATPLGPELERQRHKPYPGNSVPFRSYGASTSWYPRGLLLRVAARLACARILEAWRSSEGPTDPQAAQDAAAHATADAGLNPDALLEAIDATSASPGDASPRQTTDRFMASLEAQAATAEEIAPWTAAALEKVKEFAGAGSGLDPDTTWKKSRFYRGLQLAAKQLAEEWNKKLTAEVMPVLTLPGHRLANAEAAMACLGEFCAAAGAAQRKRIEKQYEVVKKTREELQGSLMQCQGGGFSLFGGGKQRAVRNFMQSLGQFARQRVLQDLMESVLQFFKFLGGQCEDRLNDLSFTRQRLKALQQVLATPELDDLPPLDEHSPATSPTGYHDPFWHSVQSTSTVEVVLPGGVATLEESAAQFVDSLQNDHWFQLDQQLQDSVLAPLGNLVSACTGNMNLTKYMGSPLIENAAQFLGDILPITDVAQVQFSAARAQGHDVADECRKLHELAAPQVSANAMEGHAAYLLVPNSDEGKAIGDLARKALPHLAVVRTDTRTEMTFCREQAGISQSEFQKMLDLCRMSYQELAPQPATSPHARFDVLEWVPLEP